MYGGVCGRLFGYRLSSLVTSMFEFEGGRSDGRNCCSSSVWKRLSTNANASGEAQVIEQLWDQYFADPSQWWDNRVDKSDSESPDFKHKLTRKALWVDGWSTPSWVKAMLKLVIDGKLQPHVGFNDRDSQGFVRPNRVPKNNNRNGNSQPSTTEVCRQTVQVDDVNMDMQSTGEATPILKNYHQGIPLDSNMYVEVLQRCFKEKDLVLAKQVHGIIIKSGMQQNTYVVNNLLRVYIRCGRMNDARQVFDKLVKKNIFSWTIMIGGYAQHNPVEDAIELFNHMLEEGVQPNEVTYLNILKACASPQALKWGKEVHAHIQHAGYQTDVRVVTALLKMYINSGSITDARVAFDRMMNRNVITWTVMIGGLAQHGFGHEAFSLFLQMQQEGFVPNTATYLSILNPSANTGALEWVREVNSHALKAGIMSDVRVGSAFVHMYAKCGSIEDAHLVFDKMVDRDVITWNVMIGGLAEHGFGHEAFSLFLQMQQEGFKPYPSTYLSILNPGSSIGSLEWVKELHTHALNAGLESNVRVSSAFVHMYAKNGSIDDARLVFNRMVDKGFITWNVMIGGLAQHGFGHEAFSLFLQMQQEGFKPDAITYLSILNACASTDALEWVKDVYSHALKAGLMSDLRVGNAFVHMYAKSGSIDDARLVFDSMANRNVITWTTMIGGLAQHGFGHEALSLFLQMQQEGFVPNAATYSSILNPRASTGALEWVKEVHRHALKAGLMTDVRVGSALVHMYAKSGSIDDARLVFDRMVDRNVITWTMMIGGLAEHGFGHEAFSLFLQMHQEGFVPNAVTYSSILNSCASAGALEWVKEVHSHALKAGLGSDLRVGNALVHMYAKSGSIDDARLVFDRMVNRDVITWTMMIGGLAEHGFGHEALQVYEQMKAEHLEPDGLLFVAVLTACSHAGLVDEGRRHFLAMTQDYGIKPSLVHYNCMVDLLGRAGHLGEAKQFIHDMPVKPDGASWGALLGACINYGNVEMAELAAKERLKLEPEDASTYVLLSNIYAGAGNWDQVSLVRTMMQEKGLHKEQGCSWIEVDNKIHHFVAGDTSHPEAKEIYAELNRLTEKMKADGYIPDTRLVLHNIDEEDKDLALCSHSEKLAISYGSMRTPPGKLIRIYKNLRVCSDCHTATKFISKVTGRVIVARDANRFHYFKDGKCSCSDYW